MSLKFKQLQLGLFISIIFFLFGTNAVLAQVSANFSADTTFGCGSIGVQFNNQSSGNITSWNWDFGNGNTSILENPFENYVTLGRYTVSLTVSDGITSDTETKTGFIKVYKNPVSNFAFTPTSGCPPLVVNFSDSSIIGDTSIKTYIWDFGDGSQPINQANPVHTYSSRGNFIPSLQIIDEFGCSNTKSNIDTVRVFNAPIVSFTTSNFRVSCTAPYTVNFQNNSIATGPNVTYSWSFGDGNTSNQKNPNHTYTSFGSYTVNLTVDDGNCRISRTINNYIRLEPIDAKFSVDINFGCLNELIQFSDSSKGANTISWDFGDGSPFSFQSNPSHRYRDTGTFIVTLNASGTGCLDTYTDTIRIEKVTSKFVTLPDTTCILKDTVFFIDSSFNASTYEWRIPNKTIDFDTVYFFNTPNASIIHENSGTYSDTLIVTSPYGCKDTSINSRVIEAFNTNILINDSLTAFRACLPFSLSFKSEYFGPGVPVSWNWDFGNGSTSNQEFPPNRTYNTVSNNEITLSVTNNLGCIAYDTTEVSALVKEDPSFIFFPDTVCQGDSLTIQMTNSTGSIYQFFMYSDSTSAVGIVEKIKNYTVFTRFQDTGRNYISVNVGNGCDTTGFIDTFFVKGPMAFPYATFDCTTPLNVSLFGEMKGVTRFEWDFGDGSPIETSTVNPVHQFTTPRIYLVKLTTYNDTNSCGPDSVFLSLDLRQRLPPNDLPFRKNYCKEDSIRLYFNNSLFYPAYEWYVNGNYVSNVIDSTYPISILKDGINRVRLLLIEQPGCYDTVDVNVYLSNPLAKISSNIKGGCLPYTVNFVDSSNSPFPLTDWQWIFSSNPNDTLFVGNPTVTFSQKGNINVYLRIIDSLGCSADTLYSNYLNSTDLNVDFVTSSNLNICVGDSVQFVNRTSGLNIENTWDFGEGNRLIDNNQVVSYAYNQPGNFQIKLIVVDGNGCADSLSRYTISVESKPIAGFTADTTFATCYPLGVNFQDTSSGSISRWIWDLGKGDSIGLQNPFRNFTEPGSYNVQLIVESPNGCRDTASFNNYINISGPTASFEFDKDTACLNEDIVFNILSQNGVDNFRWAFGDGSSSITNPTTHRYTDTTGTIIPSIILYDSTGKCEVTTQGDPIFISNVISKFEVSDTLGCAPFNIQLTNLSAGQSSFVWRFGDGTTNTQDFSPTYTYVNPGNFLLELEVNSTIGCEDKSEIEITVHPSPTAAIEPQGPICIGDTAILRASGGLTYLWSPNQFLNSITNPIVKAFPDTTTLYSVEVKNQFDCFDTSEIELRVIPKPINRSNIDTTLIIGENIIVNYDGGSNDYTYSWSPTNGLSCANCPNPKIQPLRSQLYTIEIRDENGCFDTSYQVNVEVIEKYSLDVPSAFTPNNDGNNDIIYANGWGLKELISFKIYNRFGELLFESSDFDKGWDGTYKGVPQNIETYVYTVEAMTFGEEVLTKKGNISLLR